MDIKSPRYLVLFAIKSPFHWVSIPSCASYKGDWILQDILTLVLLPKKGAILLPWAETVVYCKGWEIPNFCSEERFSTCFLAMWPKGGFICTFPLLIFLSSTFRTSKVRNQFTISSKYFDMVCCLKREVQRNDIWTDNIQSFEMPF